MRRGLIRIDLEHLLVGAHGLRLVRELGHVEIGGLGVELRLLVRVGHGIAQGDERLDVLVETLGRFLLGELLAQRGDQRIVRGGRGAAAAAAAADGARARSKQRQQRRLLGRGGRNGGRRRPQARTPAAGSDAAALGASTGRCGLGARARMELQRSVHRSAPRTPAARGARARRGSAARRTCARGSNPRALATP